METFENHMKSNQTYRTLRAWEARNLLDNMHTLNNSCGEKTEKMRKHLVTNTHTHTKYIYRYSWNSFAFETDSEHSYAK